jgi:hypothetical protein
MIVILDFVWLIAIGVLSGYCAYYERILDANQSSYFTSYYNSIIYNIGAFGAAAVSFKWINLNKIYILYDF